MRCSACAVSPSRPSPSTAASPARSRFVAALRRHARACATSPSCPSISTTTRCSRACSAGTGAEHGPLRLPHDPRAVPVRDRVRAARPARRRLRSRHRRESRAYRPAVGRRRIRRLRDARTCARRAPSVTRARHAPRWPPRSCSPWRCAAGGAMAGGGRGARGGRSPCSRGRCTPDADRERRRSRARALARRHRAARPRSHGRGRVRRRCGTSTSGG